MQNSFSLPSGCIFLLLAFPLPAQDFPRNDFNPERLVDEIFPIQNLDINYEEWYENRMQILANPIDLNRATAEELRSFFVLSQQQIESLLAYRRENGPFLSVYELQSIPDFDSATLYRLMPFVKVEDMYATLDKSLVHRLINERNGYFITRYERSLEKKQGYREETDSVHRYAGTPDKIYWRFRSSRAGDFSVGFTAEKDAGEAITWNPSRRYYGADYFSFHGQILNKGRARNLIVGDYQAQFGQGLVLGGGFGMGKGSETVTTLRRSNLGFIPYTSLNEFGFFRGGAVSYWVMKDLTVHGFASSLRRDALPRLDSLDESSLISSFAISGYHRTAGEMASRRQINETNYGAVVDYHHRSLDAGLIMFQTGFSLPIIHTTRLYNQFYFTGYQNTDVSCFLNFSKDNIAFFSEAAQTLHHGKAIVAGLLGSLTPQLDISLLYRNFSRDFHSFYSNAVSENTTPQNETGFYWGLKYAFNKKYYLFGYLDLFRFPWLRYRDYAPSDGSEWMLRFTYQPSKTVSFSIQAREESKIRNLTKETSLYQTGIGLKRNFRINCDYSPHSRLSFKTRATFSTYTLDGPTSRGLVLLQDVDFDIGKFSFSVCYALFDTENYDNRLYIYERDVWLAFTFPAYEGVGVRRYAMVQYKISRQVDLWVRWANTQYADKASIGSAGEAITGNVKNDVKLQLRIKL